MLLSRRALRVIGADLDRTAAALARLAARHRDTPAVGRTLSQHAVPTTFGLRAAGWYELAATAAGRVRALAATLPVSLGGAAGTLAGYIEQARLRSVLADDPSSFADGLVAAYAAETGLAEQVLPWHTLRVPVADLGATMALVTGALGKFAVDVLGMARTEVGEVAEPAGEGRGGSSAMPQKRNPVLATLIRVGGAAGAGPGRGAGAVDAGRGRAAGRALARRVAAAAGLPAAGRRGGGDRGRAGRGAGGVPGPAAGQPRADRQRGPLRAAGGGARPAGRPREVLARASAEAERTGASLAAVLAARRPEVALTEAELARLLDPLRYLGAAGHLVDRALADRDG